MKYPRFSPFGALFCPALIAVALFGQTVTCQAQEKKPAKAKGSVAAKVPAASTAKAPGAVSKYDQFLSANLKLLNVLSRYADTLSGATDAATAGLALNQMEAITKEAINAGEALVKLGRATPEMEAKLAKDPDIQVTSQRVAEQTRSAVKALANNTEAKTILTPAIENFQSALNRIQQDANDPKGLGSSGIPGKTKAPIASAPAGKPANAPPATPDTNADKKARASEASSVPPPPPQ